VKIDFYYEKPVIKIKMFEDHKIRFAKSLFFIRSYPRFLKTIDVRQYGSLNKIHRYYIFEKSESTYGIKELKNYFKTLNSSSHHLDFYQIKIIGDHDASDDYGFGFGIQDNPCDY